MLYWVLEVGQYNITIYSWHRYSAQDYLYVSVGGLTLHYIVTDIMIYCRWMSADVSCIMILCCIGNHIVSHLYWVRSSSCTIHFYIYYKQNSGRFPFYYHWHHSKCGCTAPTALEHLIQWRQESKECTVVGICLLYLSSPDLFRPANEWRLLLVRLVLRNNNASPRQRYRRQ